MYATGEDVLKDEAEAVKLVSAKPPSRGTPAPSYNLGVMYANGRGVLKDDAEAARWFRLAAEQGVASAQYNLGLMYANGRGRFQGRRRSCALVPAGRRAGGRRAPSPTSVSGTSTGGAFSRTRPKLCAGSGWLPSRASSQSPIQPRSHVRHRARAFSRTRPQRRAGTGWPPSRAIASAQNNLGNMYANGEGVLKDDDRSCALVPTRPPSRASTVPSSTSVSCTARARAFSRTTPKLCAGTGWLPIRVTPPKTTSGSCTARARAFSRTRPQRRAGTGWLPSRAMPKPSSTSGSCTTTARVVLKDDAEAGALVPTGCRAGRRQCPVQPRSHVRQRARAFSRTTTEAARWYRLAAEQGYAERPVQPRSHVRCNGRGRSQGRGRSGALVPAGRRAGRRQLRSSTSGLIYATGEGVLKDSVLAHMWSNIAGANGDARARKVRDILERDMTRAEVSRATELARVCMTSDYQDCEP